MIRIITIVGARPQFVKAAMLSRAISMRNKEGMSFEEKLIHTGQHYDENMSRVFFQEMGILKPTWQLHCGNHTHGAMTGQMLMDIEKILIDNQPDYVLVYGDTNSTLAGALAASKLHIPVVHVEAGLRSFNKAMPEEINRILTDHVSSILCCPTQTAVQNLHKENITKGVYHVGDIMYDAALLFGKEAEQRSTILQTLGLSPKEFLLCTVHRAENTDSQERLCQIAQAWTEIAASERIVIPLHPRTKIYLEKYNLLATLQQQPNILFTDPLGFLDMVMLERNARIILTDSGGIQKEAYFHKTPCITLREETEWTETIESGWNQLAGFHAKDIIKCLSTSNDRKEIQEYGGEVVTLWHNTSFAFNNPCPYHRHLYTLLLKELTI